MCISGVMLRKVDSAVGDADVCAKVAAESVRIARLIRLARSVLEERIGLVVTAIDLRHSSEIDLTDTKKRKDFLVATIRAVFRAKRSSGD